MSEEGSDGGRDWGSERIEETTCTKLPIKHESKIAYLLSCNTISALYLVFCRNFQIPLTFFVFSFHLLSLCQ